MSVYIQNIEDGEPVQVLSRGELRAIRIQQHIEARQLRSFHPDDTETELDDSETELDVSEIEEEDEKEPSQKRPKLFRQNAETPPNYLLE